MAAMARAQAQAPADRRPAPAVLAHGLALAHLPARNGRACRA